MNRISKSSFVAGVVVALVVGLGAAAAIAADGVLSPSEESKAVIDDAASQLGVEPAELSGALRQALKNRIDAAVAAGRLTEGQATELKERIDTEDFPLLGRGGPGLGFDGHGPSLMGHGEMLAAASSYLGLTEAELRSQLADKTLAEIAKENGKSVSGLVNAMVASAEKSIDEAVADGNLTSEQAGLIKAGLEEHITARVNGELGPHGMRGTGLGPMHGGHSMHGDGMGPPGWFAGPPA